MSKAASCSQHHQRKQQQLVWVRGRRSSPKKPAEGRQDAVPGAAATANPCSGSWWFNAVQVLKKPRPSNQPPPRYLWQVVVESGSFVLCKGGLKEMPRPKAPEGEQQALLARGRGWLRAILHSALCRDLCTEGPSCSKAVLRVSTIDPAAAAGLIDSIWQGECPNPI